MKAFWNKEKDQMVALDNDLIKKELFSQNFKSPQELFSCLSFRPDESNPGDQIDLLENILDKYTEEYLANHPDKNRKEWEQNLYKMKSKTPKVNPSSLQDLIEKEYSDPKEYFRAIENHLGPQASEDRVNWVNSYCIKHVVQVIAKESQWHNAFFAITQTNESKDFQKFLNKSYPRAIDCLIAMPEIPSHSNDLESRIEFLEYHAALHPEIAETQDWQDDISLIKSKDPEVIKLINESIENMRKMKEGF